MTEIFIDIENTLIDDLYSCTLLQENVKRIADFIKAKIEIHPADPNAKVNLFTWGWKTKDEIRDYVVDWLFESLEVPQENRGVVWTKDDSIECAYRSGWVNTKDEVEIEDLHVPGAMKRYGLDKQMCFIKQAMDHAEFPGGGGNDAYILIDDTNPVWDETRTYSTNDSDLSITFYHPEAF